MTNRCVKCLENFEASYRGNVCDGCTEVTPGFPNFKPGLSDNLILMKGTQWETKMKKSEEAEIRRGVPIPRGDGKFYQGRLGENGKIQEKPIGN